MSARVTVGLPISSQVATFESAIRSVFAQTSQSWNLIIVLDGSPQVVRDKVMAIDDPRVLVIDDGVNKGLSVRLNEIAARATGDFIARMDADDVMHPDRVRAQLEEFDSGDAIDVLATRAYTIDDEGEVMGILPEHDLPTAHEEFLRSHFLSHPTVMMRRDWALRHQYDPSYRRGEDKELWLRASQTSVFAKLETPVFFYRVERDPNPAKQALSAKHDRMLLRERGPDVLGRGRTAIEIAKSYVRQVAYRVAVVLSLDARLYRRHFAPVPEAERIVATRELARAQSAHVPGWNDVDG